MRLCIPAQTDEGLGAPRCRQYSLAPYLMYVDIESDCSFSLAMTARAAAAGPVPDADAVLVVEIQPASLKQLREAGLRVFCECATATVEAAAAAFVGGRALPAE